MGCLGPCLLGHPSTLSPSPSLALLSTRLFVYLLTCLPSIPDLLTYPFTQFTLPLTYSPTHLPTHPSSYPPTHLPVYLPSYLSTYPLTQPSPYLPTRTLIHPYSPYFLTVHTGPSSVNSRREERFSVNSGGNDPRYL